MWLYYKLIKKKKKKRQKQLEENESDLCLPGCPGSASSRG